MPPLMTSSYAMSVLAGARSARASPDCDAESLFDDVRDAREVLPGPLRPGRSVRRQRLFEDRHALEVGAGHPRGERDVLVHQLDGERGIEVSLDDAHRAPIEVGGIRHAAALADDLIVRLRIDAEPRGER